MVNISRIFPKYLLYLPLPNWLDVQGDEVFAVHDDVAPLELLVEEREDGNEGSLRVGSDIAIAVSPGRLQ